MEALNRAGRTAAGDTSAAAPALRIENLSKHFGGAAALDGVDLTVGAGEVHGLLGQNGSGKSTLIKVLAGFHDPDPGARLWIGGEEIALPLSAGEFRRVGIAFVHQHLGLIPSMTVIENLLVGDHATEGNWHISWGAAGRRARALFARFGLDLDPFEPVERLSSVRRALLAIVRAFDQLERTGTKNRLLVLDEPTPFLPSEDVGKLFALVRGIVAEGASVIFVSHDIDEVMEITDTITVLRDGRVAGNIRTEAASKMDIVRMIVGRAVDLEAMRPPARELGAEAAILTGLSGRSVTGLSMRVSAGEVVGITGLIGSGYDEVVSLAYGAVPATGGFLTLDGREFDLARLTPHAAIEAGIVFIPADRHAAGIVPTLSVADNVTLPILDQFNAFFLNWGRMSARAAELNEALAVRPRDPAALMSALSGGNQQKVVLNKWFQKTPKLVLLDEPTQGVDIGAREQVFGEIRRVAAAGAAIVCASSDHEQLAAICDRVLVMAHGELVATLDGEAISKAAIAEACYGRPDQTTGVHETNG